MSGDPRLGRIRIPPLPKQTALVDRSDGKTYAVAKSGSTPTLSVLSTPVDPAKYWIYGAHDGPTVVDDQGRLQRLYADAGALSFEPAGAHTRQAPVDVIVKRRPLDVERVAIESGALTLNTVAL